jgi:predicted small lipoprotein YifL
MRRRTTVLILLLILALLLAGCGTKGEAPSPGATFDKEEVTARAEQVVAWVVEDNFTAVVETVRGDLQETLSEDALKDAVDTTLADAGTFVEIDATTVTEQEADGNTYAVAVIIAKYENRDVQYTLSFDENMALIGFYIK